MITVTLLIKVPHKRHQDFMNSAKRHHHLYEHNFHSKKGSAAQALPLLKEKKSLAESDATPLANGNLSTAI